MRIKRIKWPEIFMAQARLWAMRSACLSRGVGAVLVRENRVISTGYNGPPEKMPHCSTCQRCNQKPGTALDECPAIHAETNAIAYAARAGVAVRGCTLYVTCVPCVACAKAVISAGIEEVVYLYEYDAPLTKRLFAEKGIPCEPLHVIMKYGQPGHFETVLRTFLTASEDRINGRCLEGKEAETR